MRRLGELERAVMDILWRAERPMLVRDVLDQLTRQRALAYTTVMSVLDNLHRKNWVARERDGKAYRYWATNSREEATADVLRELLTASGDPDAVLLHFVRSASDRESELLREALRDRGNES